MKYEGEGDFWYECIECGKKVSCDNLYSDAIDNGRAEMLCQKCENKY